MRYQTMRGVQRFTRTDDKHIAYEITINDPKIFTKPWKNVRTLRVTSSERRLLAD